MGYSAFSNGTIALTSFAGLAAYGSRYTRDGRHHAESPSDWVRGVAGQCLSDICTTERAGTTTAAGSADCTHVTTADMWRHLNGRKACMCSTDGDTIVSEGVATRTLSVIDGSVAGSAKGA